MIAPRRPLLALAVLLPLAPLHATVRTPRPTTRLQHCGSDTCLVVRGYRRDAGDAVLIAGRPVAVRGAHAWRVALPLERVRGWAGPWARSLPVQVGGPEAEEAPARLPIGLLGHRDDLAFLDVRAPR